MSNYHIAFNTIMTKIMEKVKEKAVSTAPTNAKLHDAINLILESPTINVHVPLSRFINDVYINYREPMYNGDERFFMNEDYKTAETSVITIIKSMYSNSTDEEKTELKNNVKKLVTITDKYLSSKEKL